MATRFEISFPSIRNAEFSVYIDDADYVGTAVEVDAASDGFTTDYDGSNTDILDPIKGSRTTFNIAVSEDNQTELEDFAADLLSSAEGRFTMRIDHNTGFASDTLWWCGYVLADLSGFEDKYPPFGFRVVATDGLGRLKGIDYNDGATPPEPLGNLSFLDHINNCLTSDGLADLYFSGSDIFIRTVVNWVDSTIGTPTAAKCPLKYSRGAGSVFAKRENNDGVEEWKFDTCYEVLEKILRDWQARIYFSDGSYRIEQVSERSLDTFFERRFDKTGAYLSGATVSSYDRPVAQTLTESRLSGGIFNYLPALKEVKVTYEHRTAENKLTGTGGKWNIDSAAGDTVTISDVTTDADTIFRIQGRIYVKGALDLSYVAPWRYVFNLKVAKGGKYLTSTTASQQSNGTYLPVVVRTPYTWETSLGYYEISSEFTFSSTVDEYIPFAFDVEGMPTGGGSIDIQFTVEDARRVDGTPVAVTLTDWRVLNPAFIIINSSDVNSVIEVDREYSAINPDTGNSLILKAKNTFGLAVRGWTETKIQTTSDLVTWTDSGVFWDQGTETTNGQFGELWCREAIALMRTPTGTYSGSFHSQNIFPHHRIVLPDDTAYLFTRMTFESRELTYRGEWMRAGANRTSVTSGPTRKLGNLWAVDPSSTQPYPTGGNPGAGNGGIQASGDIAFAALAANYTGSTIAAGTITSIPLDLAVAENAFLDGDDVIVFNPTTRGVFTFTVAADSTNGDTSLAVDSVAITEDIPAGCYVLYSFLNRATTTGGGGPSLPAAVNGAILRGASGVWTAYSGANDGRPLVYDSTNGWQEEQLGTDGIANSAVTLSKIQDIATQRIIGRNTGGTGVTEQVTILQALDWIGSTQGQILYRGASAWSVLAPGTAGQVLQTNGASANPSWAPAAAGGITGSGVAGRIAYWSGTSAITSDDFPLFWDETNNRLGIGTASPASRIHVLAPSGTNEAVMQLTGAKTTGLTAFLSNTDNTTASANSSLIIQSGGASGGDPILQLSIATVTAWCVGVDNSTGDRFAISANTIPGTNDRLVIDSNGYVGINASPSAWLHVGSSSSGVNGLTVTGAIAGNQMVSIANTNNTSTANTRLTVAVGGTSAGDPTLQLSITGGTQWSVGVDNSDSDKLKIRAQISPSDGSNQGITVTNAATSLVGLNNDAPAVVLDATTNTSSFGLPIGTTAQRPSVNGSIRVNSTAGGLEVRNAGAWNRITSTATPTIAANTAAGTGATASIVLGNDLIHQIQVITGSSGVTTGSFCTVTFGQNFDAGLALLPVFSAAGSAASIEITKFYVSTSGNVSYTIACSSAPTTSTTYRFNIITKQ